MKAQQMTARERSTLRKLEKKRDSQQVSATQQAIAKARRELTDLNRRIRKTKLRYRDINQQAAEARVLACQRLTLHRCVEGLHRQGLRLTSAFCSLQRALEKTPAAIRDHVAKGEP
jgi:hypothetical protein